MLRLIAPRVTLGASLSNVKGPDAAVNYYRVVASHAATGQGTIRRRILSNESTIGLEWRRLAGALRPGLWRCHGDFGSERLRG